VALHELIQAGGRYVLFIDGEAVRCRVVRRDALFVEVIEEGGRERIRRLPLRDLRAVLEPTTRAGELRAARNPRSTARR
jgi:hypothetical protein